MEDRFIKYSRLYALIFLLFLSIPVAFGLVVAAFYGFSKLVGSQPVDIIFELVVVCLPPAVLGSANIIFFKRTGGHPKAWVRIVSKIIFTAAILGCLFVLTVDILSFFNTRGQLITDYRSFGILFLAANIGALFLVAILQAFTMPPVKDYMEKRNKEHTPLI